MSAVSDNLATAKRYIKAIESGATGDELTQFFAPEVIVQIFPSRFFPKGSRDDLAGIRAAAERGKKVMSSQRYEIRNELAGGDQVALEIDWTGTLSVPFQSIPVAGPDARPFRRLPPVPRRQNHVPAQLRLLRILALPWFM